ncbi:MAG: flippase [Ignavibacteriae bacterium]|nr:flippase [Ignavibacteriota bacterium]
MFTLKEFKRKNKVLIQNFSSLTILQISQYVFPLITFPYLVRVLGPDGYGLVAFATAFVAYFSILTDYGFNLSATRDISISRNDNKRVSEIFNSVLSVKLILLVISLLIIIPIIFIFDRFYSNVEIYLVAFLSVLGTALFPVWFFQGIEKMKFITAISVSIKMIWVILVFVFVQSREDIIILVSLNSGSHILTGLISLIVIKLKFGITYCFPELKKIKEQFIEGWHYFLSSASISLYTTSTIFILGLFAGDAIVGYYSAADKIRYAVQNISSSAGTTIFPHLSKEFKRSKEAAFDFINKYYKIVGSFMLVVSGFLYLFAKEIILLVLGDDYLSSVAVLKIISFLPLIIFFSNVAGVQTMLNLGYKKEFAKFILIAGIFSIVVSLVLVPIYFEIGTAITVVLTEIIVTAQMLLFLRRKKINVLTLDR